MARDGPNQTESLPTPDSAPESAAETAARFSEATHVLIENAGHNLYMVSTDVTDVIAKFMHGERILTRRIYIEPPRLSP